MPAKKEEAARRSDTVMISWPKSLIDKENEPSPRREGSSYNIVRIPNGTMVDGQDLGGYSCYPIRLQEYTPDKGGEKYKGAIFFADSEVHCSKTVRDAEASDKAGKFVAKVDADGKAEKNVVKVAPDVLKAAVDEQRNTFRERMMEQREKSKDPVEKADKAAKKAKEVEAQEPAKEAQKAAPKAKK